MLLTRLYAPFYNDFHVDANLTQGKTHDDNRIVPYSICYLSQLGSVGRRRKRPGQGLQAKIGKIPSRMIARAIERGRDRGGYEIIVARQRTGFFELRIGD